MDLPCRVKELFFHREIHKYLVTFSQANENKQEEKDTRDEIWSRAVCYDRKQQAWRTKKNT